jgi:outer membrane protein
MRAIAGFLLLVAGALSAQDVPTPAVKTDVSVDEKLPSRSLKFADAIELGMAYNLGLRTARFDALIARLQVEREDSAWDWTLDSEFGIGEALTPSRSTLAGAGIVETESANFALGVTKTFRSGPSLGLSWRNDRYYSNSSFNTLNPAYETNVDLTLTVPLLRGRGSDAQEAGLRASEAAAEAARFDFYDRAERLIQEVADAYWNLVFLQERIKVLKKALGVAQDTENVELRKLKPDIGRATKLTVAQAEAERHRREADLIAGQLDAANASDALRRLILPFTGEDADAVVLEAKSELRDQFVVAGLAPVVQAALGKRYDLRRAESNIQRLQEVAVDARNNLRVRLDFDAALGTTGLNSAYESSVSDAFRGDTPNYRGALIMSWPIGRRDAKAAVRQAEYNIDKARVERQERVNGIVSEVRIAHRTLISNMREIVVRRQELKASLVALEGERKRLQRGATTVLDVARLEENTVNAALRLLQAQTELERAQIELLRSTGSLLQQWDVKFDKDLNRKKSVR